MSSVQQIGQVSDASAPHPVPQRAGTARRIVFLNKYFYPDHSATSQLLTDLAFHLARSGEQVRVLASRQLYDDPSARLPEQEEIDGVAIRRISTTSFGRATLLGRGVDYLSFYRSAWRCLLEQTAPGDILVAKTDPPLLCVPALQAARRRGLRLVNWLQDLYPEIAVELGVPLVKGPVASGLYRLRDAALREAAANVVIGDRMADLIRARGAPPERIHVFANWTDDEEIRPLARLDNPLRRDWGLGDRFVVGYSGNLGRGHEFDTVLGAAELLHDLTDVVFLMIGGGSGFGALRRQVAERGLEDMFRFLPYQDRATLKYSLGVPDLHWLSLRPELEGTIVPGKLYGIAAAGRPIVAITAADGEVARLVRKHGSGFVVTPGDGARLASELRRLRADPDSLAQMGVNARRMLEGEYTRRHAYERWRNLFAGLT